VCLSNWKIRGLEFRVAFATACSSRSSQQASRTASGLGWHSPGRPFATMVATFGMSRPPVLVLLSAFPSLGLVFNRTFTRRRLIMDLQLDGKKAYRNRRQPMAAQTHRREFLQASVTSVAVSTPSVARPVAVGQSTSESATDRNGKFRPNGARMVISVSVEVEVGAQLPSGGERPLPPTDPKYSDFQKRNGMTTASKRESHVCCWCLPAILSTTAGAVDVIGFLVFGGLFTAHITGNLVVVAAHYVTGGFGQVGPVLAVPVFVAALGLVVLLFGGIESRGKSRGHC
jgi:Protein of unknown function (DUF1275)